jgi:hypothetical protein
MHSKTRALAAASLCCAAGTVLLYVASLLPAGVAGAVLLASAGVAAARICAGPGWAWACFAVTAALAWILLPSRYPALLYTVFLGYYPLLALTFERIRSVPLRWAAKLAVFNAAAAALFFLASAFFPGRIASAAGKIWILFLAGNVVFVLYDKAVRELLLYCIRTVLRRT